MRSKMPENKINGAQGAITNVERVDDVEPTKLFGNNRSAFVATTKSTISIAKRRWKILARALCHRNVRNDSESIYVAPGNCAETEMSVNAVDRLSSIRRFTSFDLFQRHRSAHSENAENWFIYWRTNGSSDYSAQIHCVNRTFTPDDLIGFNNTGNICVWPSEEVLAHYALAHLHLFRGKRILELGGGMTCLAGLFVAKYAEAELVQLTDGNRISVANVQKTMAHGDASALDDNRLRCSVLQWEHVTDANAEKFDVILTADCLFFDSGRQALVMAIWHCLQDNGCAFVMAPKRGSTLNQFVGQAMAQGFCCDVIERYDDVVWAKHLWLKQTDHYDEDIHYPILIRLKKKPPNDS